MSKKFTCTILLIIAQALAFGDFYIAKWLSNYVNTTYNVIPFICYKAIFPVIFGALIVFSQKQLDYMKERVSLVLVIFVILNAAWIFYIFNMYMDFTVYPLIMLGIYIMNLIRGPGRSEV